MHELTWWQNLRQIKN